MPVIYDVMFTNNKGKTVNNIKYQYLPLAFALIGTSTTIIAEPFSYTFISANYEIFSEDIDGVTEDFEGDAINLSFGLNVATNFAIIGSYGTGSADVTSGGTTIEGDVDVGGIGVLFHTPIHETTDFVAGIQLIKGTIDLTINGASVPSEDSDGNTISVGIRTMVSDKVELNGFLGRTKIEDDSSTDISVGASYYIDKLFTLDAGYSFNSDGNSLTFGATKYF